MTNTCHSNCGSVVLDTAFISGIKTVEYEFNSTVPDVVARDVEITKFGSSALAAVLRFENISGGADLFSYSANVEGGYPSDVGIPGSFQSETMTISDNALSVSSLNTPTSTQPGFCLKVTGAPCSPSVAYPLTSAVPEPFKLSLFGAGVAGAAFVRRRRKTARQL